ncbi:hypothetical protein Pint_28602 [Pistacia integerrima]|uniref:Uncharacterized protein n=1 Tax=Pistacia integerrima TaxID=434235 RepID=A0ACC0YNP4_9ROSI|nr:hypothetical protein Pint_28602 [Pistacia integerrima]
MRNFPPANGARVVYLGCFLRYSDTPFFADNQTTDITPFLKPGGSSKKKAIIGGTVAGGISLLTYGIVCVVHFIKKKEDNSKRGYPRSD